jgi:hypothetical protein
VTPQIFASLWTQAKRQETPDDAELARIQKYMVMHDDMHAHFERFAQDPSQPPIRDGENLMLHIIMDATIEKALEWDQPPGIRKMLQGMLDGVMRDENRWEVPAAFLGIAHEGKMTHWEVYSDASIVFDLMKARNAAEAAAK